MNKNVLIISMIILFAAAACKKSEFSSDSVLFYPNSFTPDGDGNNDLFFIDNSCLKEFTLEIYDRWGLKMVEISSGGWDGRTKSGVEASDGTYYYMLKATSLLPDKKYDSKGFISLVRKK